MDNFRSKKKVKIIVASAFAVIVVVGIVFFYHRDSSFSLGTVHQAIVQRFDNVEHISADEFSKFNTEDVVVFDVRQGEEFRVSHIDGAIHVSPELSVEAFWDQFSERIKDKTLVFYCSVGWRSSEFGDSLKRVYPQSPIYNLEGGLFKWVNEQRSLVGNGIHPYDAVWGQLIEDQSIIRYKN